ncbi:hypothetical protein F4815DRAFT_451380 [Daldinia loculata]|nr:hypothetical protein F4815DRAFT_451380 [Daldinia loculata]
MTIKDVLTPSECVDLLKLISPPNDAAWPAATVTAYDGSQILDLKSRFCDRIFHTPQALADCLLERILPHIPPDVHNHFERRT